MNSKQAKQRFGIIGDNIQLSNAIDVALQVAKTDISVLITEKAEQEKKTFQK